MFVAPYIIPASPAVGHQVQDTGGQLVNVKALGCKGNSRILTDVVVVSGSARITSASAPFVSTDVGKDISIPFANVVGTISAFVSATQVDLSVVPSYSVSGAWTIYGTEDTARFLVAAAQAALQGADLYVPPGVYMIDRATALPNGIKRLRGAGWLSRIVQKRFQAAGAIGLFTAGTLFDITIEDLWFQSTPRDYIGQDYCLLFSGSPTVGATLANVTIQNCRFDNWANQAIAVSYGSNIRILNNSLFNVSQGIQVASCSEALVQGNTLDGCQNTRVSSVGIQCVSVVVTPNATQHSANVQIVNNVIKNRPQTEAIMFHDVNGIVCANNIITDCQWGIDGACAAGDNTMTQTIQRAQIVKNVIKLSTVNVALGDQNVNTAAFVNILAGQTVVVTPDSMSAVAVGTPLWIDTGSAMEIVVPTATTGTTFTALFSKAHSGWIAINGSSAGNSINATSTTAVAGPGDVTFTTSNNAQTNIMRYGTRLWVANADGSNGEMIQVKAVNRAGNSLTATFASSKTGTWIVRGALPRTDNYGIQVGAAAFGGNVNVVYFASDYIIEGNVIENANAMFHWSDSGAIICMTINRLSILDNRITNGYGQGIYFMGGSPQNTGVVWNDLKIEGNHIHNQLSADDATGRGIAFFASGSFTNSATGVIQHNRFKNIAGTGIHNVGNSVVMTGLEIGRNNFTSDVTTTLSGIFANQSYSFGNVPGCHFRTWTDALAAITDASTAKPYTLYAEGFSLEPAAVSPKSNVDTVGIGSARIVLDGSTNGASVLNCGGSRVNMRFKSLIFERTGVLVSGSSSVVSVDNAALDRTTRFEYCTARQNFSGGGSLSNCNGWQLQAGSVTLFECSGEVVSTTNAGYGLLVTNSATSGLNNYGSSPCSHRIEGGSFYGTSGGALWQGSSGGSCRAARFAGTTVSTFAACHGLTITQAAAPVFTGIEAVPGAGLGSCGVVIRGASRPQFTSCVSEAGQGATGNNYAWWLFEDCAPSLKGCTTRIPTLLSGVLTVVKPTTSNTAVVSTGVGTPITPVSMTSIAVGTTLRVDSAGTPEIVTVTATTGSTFTATFLNTHLVNFDIAVVIPLPAILSQIAAVSLNVGTASAASTLSIGTTAGGTDILNAAPMTATGLQVLTLPSTWQKVLAASAYLYLTVTPGAGSPSATLSFTILAANALAYGVNLDSTGQVRLVECPILSNASSQALNITAGVVTANRARLIQSMFDTRPKDAGSVNSVISASAWSPAPFEGCSARTGVTNVDPAAFSATVGSATSNLRVYA